MHPNPEPPRYPCRSASRTSLAKVPATCVQDARIGYIQDVLVLETLRIIVEPMARSVPPVGQQHSHAHLPHRLIPPTRPPCQTRRSTYYSRTPVESQQTDGTKHLPRGAHRQSAAIQDSKLTAQSTSSNIQNYTLVRQDRRLGPGGSLLFFYYP